MKFLANLFRRRLLLCSYDAVQVASARMALREGGVKFWVSQHTDDLMPRTANGRLLPLLSRAATEYRIFVDKDDLELAEYLINGGGLCAAAKQSKAPRAAARGAFSALQGSAISPVSRAVLVRPGKG